MQNLIKLEKNKMFRQKKILKQKTKILKIQKILRPTINIKKISLKEKQKSNITDMFNRQKLKDPIKIFKITNTKYLIKFLMIQLIDLIISFDVTYFLKHFIIFNSLKFLV